MVPIGNRKHSQKPINGKSKPKFSIPPLRLFQMGNRMLLKNLWFPTLRPMKTRRIIVGPPIVLERRRLKMVLLMKPLMAIPLGTTKLMPVKKSYLPRELLSNQELRSMSFNSPYLLKLCRGQALNSRGHPRFKEPEKLQTKVKIHRFMDHKPQPTNLNRWVRPQLEVLPSRIQLNSSCIVSISRTLPFYIVRGS